MLGEHAAQRCATQSVTDHLWMAGEVLFCIPESPPTTARQRGSLAEEGDSLQPCLLWIDSRTTTTRTIGNRLSGSDADQPPADRANMAATEPGDARRRDVGLVQCDDSHPLRESIDRQGIRFPL
jgi:hypothetical protein